MAIHNDTDTARVITNGERIAQLVLLPFIPMKFTEVEYLNKTERGAGGFGSTGK